MSTAQVYARTPEGELELALGSASLSTDLLKILELVDGESSLAELADRSGRLSRAVLETALELLAKDGLIALAPKRSERHLAVVAAEGASHRSEPPRRPRPAQGRAPVEGTDSPKTDIVTRAINEVERELGRSSDRIPAPTRSQTARKDATAAAAPAKTPAASAPAPRSKADLQAQELVRRTAEAEGRARAEREARIKAEGEAKVKVAELERLASQARANEQAAEQARALAAEAARLRREAEEKAKAEERARQLSVAEAKLRSETEARVKAEQLAREKAEAELRAKTAEIERLSAEARAHEAAAEAARAEAQEAAKLRAESEAKAQAEEAARRSAEQAARAQAEAEAKTKVEQEAREKLDREALLRAEAEAKANAEFEARLRAEAELQAKSAEIERLAAEARSNEAAAESARARAEAETKARVEQEAREKLDREALLRAEAEAKAHAELEARLRAEAELQAKAAEIERLAAQARAREAAAQAAQAQAEEAARLRTEAEAKAQAEEAARRQALEARAQAEAERLARVRAQAEAQAREEELKRIAAEAEAKARAAAEAAAKSQRDAQLAEAEREARLRAEAEAQARRDELARLAGEAEEAARQAEQAQARAQAEAQLRAEAEKRALEQENARREAAEEEVRLRLESEERARTERVERLRAQAQARDLAQELARQAAQANAIQRAAEQAQAQAAEEARLRQEAEAKAQAETEARQRAEEETRALAEREEAESLHEVEEPTLDSEAGRVIETSWTPVPPPERFAWLQATKRKFAKDLKWGRVVALSMVALIAIPLIGLHVFSIEPLRDRAQQALSLRLGEGVSIEQARVSLFPSPLLRLEAISVGDPPIARVQTLAAAPDWRELLQGRVVIGKAELLGVSFEPSAYPSVLRWLASDKGLPGVEIAEVSVPAVAVPPNALGLEAVAGQISLTPEGRVAKVSLRDEKAQASAEAIPGDGGLAVSLALKSPHPMGPDLLGADELTAVGVLKESELKLDKLHARAYGGTLDGSGMLTWGSRWTFTGTVSGDGIDTSQLPQSPLLAKGRLQFQASVESAAELNSQLWSSLRARGKFVVVDGELARLDLTRAMQNAPREIYGGVTPFKQLRGQFQSVRGGYDLRGLELTAGALSARGQVRLSGDSEVSGQLNATLSMGGRRLQDDLELGGTSATPKLRAAP